MSAAKLAARVIVPVLSLLSVVSLALPALAAPSPNLVISQIYGGGGNSGATLTNDFIELFNRGGAPVDQREQRHDRSAWAPSSRAQANKRACTRPTLSAARTTTS